MLTINPVGCVRSPRLHRPTLLLWLLAAAAGPLHGSALDDYVRQPDPTFAWKKLSEKTAGGFTITHLELTSQTWRGLVWRHDLQVVRPAQVRNPGIGFLLITGDGDGSGNLATLQALAERGGAVAAVVTCVPNQPLFDGRREDQIIAYTFDQYLKTGDETWPLLLPMTKSAVRALDVVQAWAQGEHQQKVAKFVVSGGSKRGWTTWLTGAVDPRVCGIAPMSIDMLNMKVQTQWAQKVYGRQSEKIRAYTELHLVDQMDTPAMVKLREIVDPYSYRDRYRMAKLILIGTNDPYWTVDSLRHYWNDLPGPKLIFDTPNAGHGLGRDALASTAAFFQMIADGQELPKMEWQMTGTGQPGVTVKFDRPAKKVLLWSASSPTRDLRPAKWTSLELPVAAGAQQVSAQVQTPATGYLAFLAEVTFTSSSGPDYRLSTQVQVTPDDIK